MTDQPTKSFRVLEVTIWSTEAEAKGLVDDIEHLLCPDLEHSGPCPIPWQIALLPADDDASAVADLQEQIRHEHPED